MSKEYLIETDNLRIRNFKMSDARDVSCYSTQPNMAYWLSDMILPNEEEALNWIKWINGKLNESDPFMILAIEHKVSGQCIGLVGIHPKYEIDNEIELMYGISDLFQNNGFAFEASQALIAYGFKNKLVESLSAIIKPENKSSIRVIQKLGFTYIESRVLPYDGKECLFEYYKLVNKR